MAGLFSTGATPRFVPLGANDKSIKAQPVDPVLARDLLKTISYLVVQL